MKKLIYKEIQYGMNVLNLHAEDEILEVSSDNDTDFISILISENTLDHPVKIEIVGIKSEEKLNNDMAFIGSGKNQSSGNKQDRVHYFIHQDEINYFEDEVQ